MEYMMKLKNLREDNDYTQEYVAQILGTSQTMYKDVNTTRHYNRSRLFGSNSDEEVRDLLKIENRTKE